MDEDKVLDLGRVMGVDKAMDEARAINHIITYLPEFVVLRCAYVPATGTLRSKYRLN